MTHVGYLAALAGGILALLSPCSALLLPAFFAYAFSSPRRLIGRTIVFYAGLALVMVPLGAGSSLVAGLFFRHRAGLVLAAGWIIIAMGLMQVAGKGFSFGPAQRWMGRLTGESVASVFALGAVYGLAGFCAGPILGSILTVAATSGSPVTGGALLAVYALGMVVPLLVLALVWERWRIGERRWLRGRVFTIGKLELHSTSVLSGLLFIALGVAFIAFGGTAGLAGWTEATGTEAAAQQWVSGTIGRIPDTVVLAAAGAVAATVLAVRWRRRANR